MALTQSFTVTENVYGTIIYLTDSTGNYDASTNTGGYGTPNTSRSALALIIMAWYKPTAGDEAIQVNAYGPEDVTQWQFETLLGDGWYQFKVYSVDIKTGAETPSINDFVYNDALGQLERWNGSAWVQAQESELETYDAAHTTVNHFHIPKLFAAYNRVNELLCVNCQCPDSQLKQYLFETDVIINGSLAMFTEGNYAAAHLAVEKYDSRADRIIQTN